MIDTTLSSNNALDFKKKKKEPLKNLLIRNNLSERIWKQPWQLMIRWKMKKWNMILKKEIAQIYALSGKIDKC